MSQVIDLPEYRKLKFTGDSATYFRIWIVNLLLSILTLGIYSAWAKVRTKRYLYGSTELDGAVFEYHATPIMILKGRLVAVALLLTAYILGYVLVEAQIAFFVLLALVAPWLICRSIAFNARMTSYRNLRFRFTGHSKKLYLYLLIIPAIPFVVVGLVMIIVLIYRDSFSFLLLLQYITPAIAVSYFLAPYIQQKVTSFYLNHHQYGQGVFQATLSTWSFYKIYLKLVSMIFLILMALVLLLFIQGKGMHLHIGMAYNLSADGFEALIPLFISLSIALFLKSYLKARIRNYTISQLTLRPEVRFKSDLKVLRLFALYFSNLLLLILTLGLAYPWTVVRLARYQLETISISGSLDSYVADIQQKQSALGEEMGEAFDLDLDLGL